MLLLKRFVRFVLRQENILIITQTIEIKPVEPFIKLKILLSGVSCSKQG